MRNNKKKLLKRWRCRESVQFIISVLLHNKRVPIASEVIFTWSPADLCGKGYSRERDASKHKARNVPLASADVRGGGRLRNEPQECLWSTASRDKNQLHVLLTLFFLCRRQHKETAFGHQENLHQVLHGGMGTACHDCCFVLCPGLLRNFAFWIWFVNGS